MARIAGVNIPQNKIVQVGLTYIYGIGDQYSKQICKDLSISKLYKGLPNKFPFPKLRLFYLRLALAYYKYMDKY